MPLLSELSGTDRRSGDVTTSEGRLYHLPGRRFAVDRRRQLPRAALTVFLLFGLAAPLLTLAARLRLPALQHSLERSWARLAVRVLGVGLHISGMEHVDPGRSYVAVPLHEGFADALALLHLPLDLRFAVRSELQGWRLLGGYLRASRQVVVDPETPVTAYRHLLAAAPGVFAKRESLVVFPQGTILGIESAFSAGAFRLAKSCARPLLPVVLSGSHRVWEHPFSPRVVFGRSIRMEVLAPIEPGEAAGALAELQAQMKRKALEASTPTRRFVPERDGWWDGYRYEIDPAFPDLAQRVEKHRASSGRASA